MLKQFVLSFLCFGCAKGAESLHRTIPASDAAQPRLDAYASSPDADAGSEVVPSDVGFVADAESCVGLNCEPVACSRDNWCWDSPRPFGRRLRAVFGTSARDVWAVGDRGTAVHFDGTTWSPVDTGTTARLTDVWGAEENEYWAVGDGGTMLRWTGAAWTSVPSGTTSDIKAVWGSGANDVWAVADETAHHWDGSAWSTHDIGERFIDVWGSGANDVWFLSMSRPLRHWDGSAWSDAGWIGGYQRAIWGSSADDVWLVQRDGVHHRNGGVWSDADPTHREMFGGGNNVWGSGPSDVWVVGFAGKTRHFDGMTWTERASTQSTLWGVWGSTSDDVWAVGDAGTIIHWNGTSWSDAGAGAPTTQDLKAVWGSRDDDIWAVGNGGTTLHYDGEAWSRVPCTSTTAQLAAVWGSSERDVWAVGADVQGMTILHFDGNAWSSVDTSRFTPWGLTAIWGSSANDVWAVGLFNTFLHWNGATWAQVRRGTGDTIDHLYSLWGSGENDVWAAGAYGTMLRWNGNAWSAVDTGLPLINPQYMAIGGSGPADVWVGEEESTLHWNGSAWSHERRGAGSLRGIWSSSTSDVWAIGGSGWDGPWDLQEEVSVIVHWNGAAWVPVDGGARSVLFGVWRSRTGVLWAVGRRGTILRHGTQG